MTFMLQSSMTARPNLVLDRSEPRNVFLVCSTRFGPHSFQSNPSNDGPLHLLPPPHLVSLEQLDWLEAGSLIVTGE